MCLFSSGFCDAAGLSANGLREKDEEAGHGTWLRANMIEYALQFLLIKYELTLIK